MIYHNLPGSPDSSLPRKPPRVRLRALVAALAIGLTLGQGRAQTATTIPIGIYVTKVPGRAAHQPPVRTYLGCALLPPVFNSGTINTVEGPKITLWAPVSEPEPARESYVHVMSGKGRGLIADIKEFQSGAVICDTDLSTWVAPGDIVRLRHHQRLEEIFGTENRFGLDAGSSAREADTIVIWNNQTQRESVYYFHSTRDRWEEAGLEADAGPTPVRFPNGLYIVRRTPGTLRVFLQGMISSAPVLLPVRTGANVFSLPIHLDGSLANRFRHGEPFFVREGRTPLSADLLTFEEPFTSTQRGPFYFQSHPRNPGWRLVGDNDPATVAQPPDLLSALIVRRFGPPGYIRIEGSEDPPAQQPQPPPSDAEPDEAPLEGEMPFIITSHPDLKTQLQTSLDLAQWSELPFEPGEDGRITFQLPPGSSRAFYRISVSL